MLEALGVNTSKTFSLIETGEALTRGDEPSPTRSSVLVRLSHSHIRIGTFQRLAFLEDNAAIGRLVDYVIAHYFEELLAEPAARRPEALLEAVTARVARLAGSYMCAGFVHGVLNSDNINVTGESFDYGPWRFAPSWDASFTAAYFDHSGLYSFGRQPGAIAWNLSRFAECLLPLISLSATEKAIQTYQVLVRAAFREALLARLGLASAGDEADARLARAFVDFMIASRAPFAQMFFDWRGGLPSAERAKASPASAHYAGPEFDVFRTALAEHLPSQNARLDHPYFAGAAPCDMLIDEVEAIWSAISERDDWGPLQGKLKLIYEMRRALATDEANAA